MATGVLHLSPSSAEFPNSAFAAPTRTAGTNLAYVSLFFDASTIESAFWAFQLPALYDGGAITVTIYWSTTATTGSCVWGASTRSAGDGDTWDAAFSEQTATDAAKAVASQVNEAAIAFTAAQAGWTAGELAQLRVRRVANDAADTLASDAELLGVKIAFTLSTA